MNKIEAFLEKTWDGLLSREEPLIKHTFESLDADSQQTVYTHLQKMVSEDGWHTEQVTSARKALEVLDSLKADKA
jgi:methionine salvage enolase-phosphatase E1